MFEQPMYFYKKNSGPGKMFCFRKSDALYLQYFGCLTIDVDKGANLCLHHCTMAG